jgi:hypothetical protein
MSALSNQIDNRPMVFPPLKMLQRKVGQLGSAQSTGQAEREDRSTPLAPDRPHVRSIEQAPGFLGGQPVSEADAQLPGSLNATNAGGRLWAHQTGVGCFVGQPSHGGQAQIDGGRCQVTGLKLQPVAKNGGLIETQSGLRAVPANEILDSESVTALSIRRA